MTSSKAVDEDALLAELDALESTKRGQVCLAGDQIATLPSRVAEAVNAVLWNRTDVTSSSLVNLLDKYGVSIREGNLNRHRRLGPTGCKCPGKPNQAAAQ